MPHSIYEAFTQGIVNAFTQGMTNAMPIKLRDGSWGAKLQGPVKSGDQIKITTKAGKYWLATVLRIVFIRDGFAIVAVATGKCPSQRSCSSRRGGRCRECGGAIVDAPHHRAMGGLCGECAFDEYDM